MCITVSSAALAQGNQFQIRYRGGTLETKVSKDDWNNKLTILLFYFKGGLPTSFVQIKARVCQLHSVMTSFKGVKTIAAFCALVSLLRVGLVLGSWSLGSAAYHRYGRRGGVP